MMMSAVSFMASGQPVTAGLCVGLWLIRAAPREERAALGAEKTQQRTRPVHANGPFVCLSLIWRWVQPKESDLAPRQRNLANEQDKAT